MTKELLDIVIKESMQYLESCPDKKIGISESYEELCRNIDQKLTDNGESAESAIRSLISGARKALIHSQNSRYYGFVIGGALPVAVAADWLTSVWDQNGQVYESSPAASIFEETVESWILEILDLPKESSIGFVTGAQMANFVGLSLARNSVLQKASWDVDEQGLQNAPHINVICSECCHGTIHSGVRMMGLGKKNIKMVSADCEGRMNKMELQLLLEKCKGPVIVSLQAGNVNTGAFDDFESIIKMAHEHGAWVHVDGAFGLWARASGKHKHLTSGIEKADSWSVDAHKWLNVPYDSGMIIVRNSEEHLKFKTSRCAYAGDPDDSKRDGSALTPENSRRSRAFVLYATLKALGRNGVEALVENSCSMAKLFEVQLQTIPGVKILNDVVLNQVLFCINPEGYADPDTFNKSVSDRLQAKGDCWIGTTSWEGKVALRISVSHYSTDARDVEQTIRSIKSAIKKELQQHHSILKEV